MQRDDVLILGGGHNGLVCAAYLAAAGLQVRVLERRHIVGGAAVTEEFHPGFRNSLASYTVSLLNPNVIRDLRLQQHGLRVVERPYANFLPLPDGRSFRLGGEHTQTEVAKWSARDAQRLPEYYAMLDRIVVVLRELIQRTPPNVSDRFVLADWLHSASVAKQLKTLDMRGRRDLLDLFTKSAGELLDDWFEGAPLKAALGWDSVVGNFASPYTPGSAYVLLHHVFGEVNGKAGAWGHAIGGMGAITQAMRVECEARGVVIETDTEVAQLLVENGKAVGVALADGRELRAATLVSNLNPKLLYTRLVNPAQLDDDTMQRMRRYRCGSGTFRMNVALSELPSFTCRPGREVGDHHTAGIVVAPSLGYMERAWMDARMHGWARAPIVEMLIPSTLDRSLVDRDGCHVASLFCQHVAPELPDGRSWDDCREEVADVMIDTIDAQAPGFKASVIARQINSPLDLERTFGLVGGDIFHGALGLDQMFSARPVLGHADHRAPISGLYMCGSGTHPGGGVTGAPGHNAAREILRDVRAGRVIKG